MADHLHAQVVPFADRAGFAALDPLGRLIGPWNGQLLTPSVAAGFNAWVAADQAHSTLPGDLREIAILSVAVAAGSDYELYAHTAAATSVEIAPEIVGAIRAGRVPPGVSPEYEIVHEFATRLTGSLAVSDPTYDRAVAVLGERAVLDLAHLVAIYIATAALLGAFAVGAPGPDDGPGAGT